MSASRDQGALDAVIVAAGGGARFGGDTPKQYRMLAGQPILRRAVRPFVVHPEVERTVVVIDPAWRDAAAKALDGLDVRLIDGGAERTASVRAGLGALPDGDPEARVLIHDGARPAVSRDLIDAVIAALDDAPAACPALPVTDSLRRSAGDRLGPELPRDGLLRLQTPQGFRLAPLRAAHAANDAAQTDDTRLLQDQGHEVRWVMGDERNLKITRPDDLGRAEAYLRLNERIAVGTGFDAHRFADDRALMLGGIAIPHERGLAGHSDADVALHAITDALLGALADADIGAHFPPSDDAYRGADSAALLEAALGRAQARGARIDHVDLTIICEAPKIGPHRNAMRERIAAILALDLDQVGVKATTMEKMGFTGRREGIAASASLTLALPRG